MNLKIFDNFQFIVVHFFIDTQTVSSLVSGSLFKLAPKFLWHDLSSV